MKIAVIGAAVFSLSVAGMANAQAEEGANPATNARNTGTPGGSRLLPNGQNADALQKGKAAKATARKATIKDTAGPGAPHRYPKTAKPAPTTVGSIRANNDGTVHKNANVEQAAGAGG